MDKKNTLLLTVIAIATLLVAVVGATFAYFSAQTDLDESVNYQVTTETGTNVVFNESTAIELKANIDNFAQEDITTPLTGKTTPSVTLTGASNTGSDLCYNVTFEISKNDFKYTQGSSKAELLLSIKKNGTEYDTAKITGLTYVEAKNLFDDDLQGYQTAWNDYKGYDVTERKDKIEIPILTAAETLNHQLHADANATQTDKWEISITFVNLNADQNANAMGKEFSGQIHFKTCTD